MKQQAALGSGLMLAPMAWFASMEANFALAPLACSGHARGQLLAISAMALGLAAAGCFLAWTQRGADRRLAFFGLGSSALFLLVIAAQAIPNLVFGGCE